MKKVVIGAVLGAFGVLAIGGAVLLGTQLDNGQEGAAPQESAEGESPQESADPSSSSTATSNGSERREFIRTCRELFKSDGEVDCKCIADEVEAQEDDPSSLTVADYGEKAQNESLIAGCLQGY
jgi:hypothetical protein